MSKIVSPYPPIFDVDMSFTIPGASWWELQLRPNEDGNLLVTKSDATEDKEPTWFEFEFFDGYNTIIDTGFDKPTKVFIDHGKRYPGKEFVRVLSVDPPTPAPGWRKMDPGE